MNRSKLSAIALGCAAMLAGCNDNPAAPLTAPEAPAAFAVAGGGANRCVGPADHVVTDEAGLLSALAAVQPGEVVAIDGSVPVGRLAEIKVADVTLTCASSGSGIYRATGAELSFLLGVSAPRVTITGLSLDASGAFRGPLYALNAGVPEANGTEVTFTHNDVICGWGECAFFVGAAGSRIAHNTFTSHGSWSGVHLQAYGSAAGFFGIDGTRIEHNIVTQVAGPGLAAFGGIRPRDGAGVVIANNTVVGPWANSVSAVTITGSELRGNRLEGASAFGLALNRSNGWRSDGNTVRNNRITGAGAAGIFARQACGNVFLGNNLNGNANGLAAIFAPETGDNTLAGSSQEIVDDGSFDCDGDGTVEPNRLSGSLRQGGGIGYQVSGAVSADPLVAR
jgi:parallel beta-helix repeat protein